jgi:murein DD-endopeptidase MepM/ murein hydrolase activator NlpD
MITKTIIFTNLPLLLLAILLSPANAAIQPNALELEQQQFLNAQVQIEPAKLEAEQDRFLQVTHSAQKPQPQSFSVSRWSSEPVAPLPVEPGLEQAPILPEEVEQPLANPALTYSVERSSQTRYSPPKKLPDLFKPEGYSRISSAPTPQSSQSATVNTSALTTVAPISNSQPKMAYVLPPSLDGFLGIQLGTERLLYPLINPVQITSVFGWRTHPISGKTRFHAGIDLGSPVGTPILAAFSGQVISSGWMGGYGNAVLLQHGTGLRSLYGHLSRLMVRPGQFVMQGTVIGLSGSTGNSTGPHLHFEMRRLSIGEWVAFDPGAWLKGAQQQLAMAMQQITRLQASQ